MYALYTSDMMEPMARLESLIKKSTLNTNYLCIFEIMDFCSDLGLKTTLVENSYGYVLKFHSGADIACNDMVSLGVPNVVEFGRTFHDDIDYIKMSPEEACEIILKLKDELFG